MFSKITDYKHLPILGKGRNTKPKNYNFKIYNLFKTPKKKTMYSANDKVRINYPLNVSLKCINENWRKYGEIKLWY